MMGEFYKMYYESWDEGCETLTIDQIGAYLLTCHQMYRRRGPVLDNLDVLSRLWKCHKNRAKPIRQALLDAGKLETRDGYLHNTRVTQEIDSRETLSTKRAEAGRKGGHSKGTKGDNSLISLDAYEAIASEAKKQNQAEKRREEEIREDSFLASSVDPDPAVEPAGSAGQEKAVSKPAAKPKAKPATEPRGSRIAADWTLPDDWAQLALDLGLNRSQVNREADRFHDFWLGKPGKDGRKADWQATWRNWVRNFADRQGIRPPGQRDERSGRSRMTVAI